MLKNFKDFSNEKIIIDLTNEKIIPQALFEADDYKYGCVMAYFNVDNWNEITNMINKEDLTAGGLEDEPHVTILYGLHNGIKHDDLLTKIRSFPNISIDLQTISLFENDKFDVVKFDIDNNALNQLNAIVSEYEHTTDYPEYHPHMTVAYVKKGEGKKYVKTLDVPIKLTSTYYIYSLSNGNKIKIDI